MQNTLIDRITSIITEHPSGRWFAITDEHMQNTKRLQIAASQASMRLDGRPITTRTQHGVVMACRMPTEDELVKMWKGQTVPKWRKRPKADRPITQERHATVRDILKRNGPMTAKEVSDVIGVHYNSAASYLREMKETVRDEETGRWTLKT